MLTKTVAVRAGALCRRPCPDHAGLCRHHQHDAQRRRDRHRQLLGFVERACRSATSTRSAVRRRRDRRHHRHLHQRHRLGRRPPASAPAAAPAMPPADDLGRQSADYNIYTDAARTNVWGDGTGGTATIANTGTGAAQNVTVYGRVPSGQTRSGRATMPTPSPSRSPIDPRTWGGALRMRSSVLDRLRSHSPVGRRFRGRRLRPAPSRSIRSCSRSAPTAAPRR